MFKSMWNGFVVLTLAIVMIGCSKPPEEKLAKERIVIIEKIADNYEKVTDKRSYEGVFKENSKLLEDLKKVDGTLAALDPVRTEAALKAVEEQFDAAMKRSSAAKKKAAVAANSMHK